MKNVRIPLVVWGKVALDLSEAIQLLSDRTLICVMKFVKLKVWKAYVMHTMCLPCPLIRLLKRLKLLPNCKLPKENISLAIVQSKPLSMVSMMSEEEDYFVKTPQKTISDILETRKPHQVGKLLVLDNIALQLLYQPCFKPTTHITREVWPLLQFV
ncbi:hypothetical protein HID58_071712 [Brassica napus]|uniref:Uncharacterized protein n=1 Tax=Brassica napus TaxID=3708 RepID=A0ABQ7Z2F1_BRANA|nr:hypothetical protein HID58_071712 [Brassica napus]